MTPLFQNEQIFYHSSRKKHSCFTNKRITKVTTKVTNWVYNPGTLDNYKSIIRRRRQVHWKGQGSSQEQIWEQKQKREGWKSLWWGESFLIKKLVTPRRKGSTLMAWSLVSCWYFATPSMTSKHPSIVFILCVPRGAWTRYEQIYTILPMRVSGTKFVPEWKPVTKSPVVLLVL